MEQRPKCRTIGRRRNYGKIVFAVIVILIIVIVGFFLIKGMVEGQSQQTDDIQSSSNEEKQESTTNNQEESQREKEKGSVAQYEGPDANTYENLTGFINYAGVVDSNLAIRATISQQVTGTCKITLKSAVSGQTLDYEAQLESGPSTSFCVQDVPLEDIKTNGKWTISIGVEGNNKSGIITGETSI